MLLFALTCAPPTRGQSQLTGRPSSQTASADESATVRGVVLNANTGQPIARVMVQLGGNAVLTSSDGKFEFAGGSGSSGSLRVTKPGYYDRNEPFPIERQVVFSLENAAIEVRMYPEAIITGTVSAPNGDPIPQVYVQALRRVDDESGEHWQMSAQAVSNADGQFRLPVVGGEYVVETQYVPDWTRHHRAVLPMIFPSGSAARRAGDASTTMHLASGTEQHVDLRPPVKPTFAIHIRMATDPQQNYGGLQARAGDGPVFQLSTRPSDTPGELIATLPAGNFTLTAYSLNGETSMYWETRVEVTDHDVFGVEMRRNKVLPLVVEIAANAGSTSDNQMPQAQELGIFFSRTDVGVGTTNQSTYISRPRRGDPAVAALPPGKYRLRAQGFGQWFIQSANVGGTDLLSQELDVDAEGSSSPLQIVLSNQTGTLKGTVHLAGQPAACWVYLLAAFPSVNPEVRFMSGQDGSFNRTYLPPGTYRILSFESRPSADLEDPATLAAFAANITTATIAAGETVTVDSAAIADSDSRP